VTNVVKYFLRGNGIVCAASAPVRPGLAPSQGRRTQRRRPMTAAADRRIYNRGLIMKRTTMGALCGVLSLAAVTFSALPGFAQSTTTSQSGALSNSNSHSNSAANSNQHQQQGQSVTYDETTPANQTIKNVPNVYAPGLAAAGSEVCLGSLSAGGAAAGFGLTVGGTMVDQEWQLRMNARTLATLGYAVAAREEMCVDPQVRTAMLAAGTPCAADRLAAPQARAEYEAPVAQAAAQPAREVSAVAASSASATTLAGCHRRYQLVGGWYDVCPAAGQVGAASAEVATAEAAPPVEDSASDASGCRRGYQLFGGWYDQCK
jgi:hypothetical protein